MSNFESTTQMFKDEMNAFGLHYHEETYNAIAKHLGPSLYDEDSSLVACSDNSERETIKKNFLIGKLGLEDSPKLDAAIEEVCHAFGESNRKKHRVTFYYLLLGVLNVEEQFMANQ